MSKYFRKNDMAYKNKSLSRPFEVKAVDEEERTFEGLASTWDLDRGGDVIHPGAFKKTLKEWKKSKRVVPLLDQHRTFDSVRAVVGKMLEAEETDKGLWAKFQVIDGPDGDEVLRRIKGGYVSGLSIGYRPVKVDNPSEEERRGGIWRHLKEVKLREVSVVIFPMNEGAEIDLNSVKSIIHSFEGREDLTDEDREQLKDLRDQLNALLDKEPQPEQMLEQNDEKRANLEARIRDVRLRAAVTHRLIA